MTGQPINSFADGIFEDGEWISWDWINGQIEVQELQVQFPKAEPEVIRIFNDLVDLARDYKDKTGRYLQIWGELGEFYAEIHYGIARHAPGTSGSDGRLGNDWVEVKTISPEKSGTKVEVKKAGNFNKLLVVRISQEFGFESRMINRSQLKKKGDSSLAYKWEPNSPGS